MGFIDPATRKVLAILVQDHNGAVRAFHEGDGDANLLGRARLQGDDLVSRSVLGVDGAAIRDCPAEIM